MSRAKRVLRKLHKVAAGQDDLLSCGVVLSTGARLAAVAHWQAHDRIARKLLGNCQRGTIVLKRLIRYNQGALSRWADTVEAVLLRAVARGGVMMLETRTRALDVFGDTMRRRVGWGTGQSLSIPLIRVLFRLIGFLTRGQFPPLPSVGVVVERENEVLLIDRRDGLGLGFPGGIMKCNETAAEALRREVLEETGYEVIITGLVGIYTDPDRDPRFSSLGIVYTGTIMDGQEKSSSEGAIVWIPKDALPVKLAFDHERVLLDYLMGHVRLY